MNLEWPFLFAAGASIMRNSHLLHMRMEQEKTGAENKAQAAESRRALRSSSPFERLFQWFNEDFKTVGSYEREAMNYHLRAARTAELAHDDRTLAAEIWESVRDYSDLIGALTYHDGKKIDIEAMMEPT